MPKGEQLPRDLVGDILSLLPLKSLARFRAVCKEWNTIWEDKSFTNHYLSRTRPQFMVATRKQTCSIEINLDEEEDHVLTSIVERDITSEYHPCQTDSSLGYCDGFVLFGMHYKGFAIWNPWTRQNKFIEKEDFSFRGIGYDHLTGYKIFALKGFLDSNGEHSYKVAIYECKSDVWKFINDTGLEPRRLILHDNIVSIKGNLYFVTIDTKTREYFLQSFDFSEDKFKTICGNLPRMEGCYAGILAVFKGDRVSLLLQSEKLDMKVEILVSKQRVDKYGEVLEWINYMTASIPNFPSLQPYCLYPRPTYFVDVEKRLLFVCAFDETEHLCIYIVKGDVLSKIPIKSVLTDIFFTNYMSYIPSFISIPCVSREMF